jgi:hypothetical protein
MDYTHYTGADSIYVFDSLEKWQITLRKMHPDAEVRIENGVHRAFVEKLKVAVFGNMPGMGYVGGLFVASLIHPGTKKRPLYMAKKVKVGV